MRLIEELESRDAILPEPAQRKRIRVAAAVSHERLARELGVHRLTVLRWESGASEPNIAVRARYAELLRAMRDAAIN